MDNVKKDLASGVFWSAIEKYSSLAISIIITMVLARLLSPDDYGVIAIATVIIYFLQLLCTMGIGPAVVQKKDLSETDINNIFSFTIYLGLALSGLFFLSSYFIASFYNNDVLLIVCQILVLQVFFGALNMVPNALMLKDKRFKVIAKRTVVLQVSTGVLAIIAAFTGMGVYSLLISPILTSIGCYIWNRIYYKLLFKPLFSTSSIKKIFSYSLYQFLFDFVNYFSRNLDKLLIGKFLSFENLGYYEKSYRLMQLPLQNVSRVISPVLQPVLSDYQNELNFLCDKYEKVIRYIAFVSFPLGLILFSCSYEIIAIFYGSQWYNAVPSFKILAISVPLQLILSTTGGVYQSCNATKNLFYVGLRNSSMTIAGFVIALYLKGTIEAVSWGWTLTSFLCFVSSFYELYKRVFCLPMIRLLKLLYFPFLSMLISYASILCIELILPDNIIISIIVKGLVVVCLSLMLIQYTGQFDLIEFIEKSIKNKK